MTKLKYTLLASAFIATVSAGQAQAGDVVAVPDGAGGANDIVAGSIIGADINATTGSTNINTAGTAQTTIGNATSTSTNINGADVNITGATTTDITGVTTNINVDSGTNVTNIGTGTTTGAVNVGTGNGNVAIGNTTGATTTTTISGDTVTINSGTGNTVIGSGTGTTTIGNATGATNISTAAGADVNIGSATGTTVIRGLGTATNNDEAVSFGQYSAGMTNLNNEVEDLKGGVASAIAIANIPGVPAGKQFAIGFGGGTYAGENAGALKLSFAPQSMDAVQVNASVAMSGGDTGAGVGVSYGF